MENCWFKLKQTHYPPPPGHNKIINGCAGGEAPICLGHVITDLRRLDQPLNPFSVQPFSGGMRAWYTKEEDLKWDGANSKHGSGGGHISGTAAPGTTVNGSLQAVFQASVQGHEEYDRVDKYIINPTAQYVTALCAKEKRIAREATGLFCRPLYMVTGLCMARKGKSATSESHSMAVGGGVGVDVSGAGGASANAAVGHSSSTSTGASHAGSRVWAIRLTKFRRNCPTSEWKIDTVTRRAAFNHGDEEIDVARMISEEGFKAHVVEDRRLGCAIVTILD